MSAPSPPPDNSVQIEQMQEQQAREAQQRQDALDAQHKSDLANLRTNARTAAGGNVNSYFSQQGIDPSQFTGDINSYLDNTLAGINPTDENPATYFKDAGPTVFNSLQQGARAKAGTALDKIFSPNYATTRIPFTLDDPYLDSIQAEQRSSADAMVKSMLDRGVITNSGYTAAEKDLDNQAAGVKSQLNELGTTAIAGGQQKLTDIANKARQDAANLNLGTQFDPFTYSGEADAAFNDFINNLGSTIRSKVPGNLFNTTGLGAIAGAAQGAGNTAFDPAAVAGLPQDDSTNSTDTTKKESIF